MKSPSDIILLQRPTTKELLQHRFIRTAKKTSYLTELIERYQDYRSRQPGKGPQMYAPTVRNSGAWDGTVRSEWNFDTMKSTSAMGSYRSMIRDFGTHGSIPDEDEYAYGDDGGSTYEAHESVQTDGATKGSDVPSNNSLMSNAEASHSTVVIRPITMPPNEKDLPSLLQDNASDETAGSLEPATPPQQSMSPTDNVEPPPAYSGSVRSQRRASYAARNNVTSGTVLVEADLGNGIDTIRPVKKVDTVRSLRLSEEFVGTLKRDRSGSGSASGSAPSSPVNSKMGSGKKVSEAAKAGVAMVNEVLLPTLDRVRQVLADFKFLARD